MAGGTRKPSPPPGREPSPRTGFGPSGGSKSGRKPAPPPGLGASGRRLWREFTEELELEPGEYTLLAQAARTVDAAEWLTSVADDPELSTAERRLAHAEAARQRTVLARLLDQLKPDETPAVSTPARSNLARLRAMHGRSS